VWIGADDGYVHRVRIGYSTGAGAGRETIALTMGFSDFGKDVNVQTPQAAQTSEANDTLLKGLGA